MSKERQSRRAKSRPQPQSINQPDSGKSALTPEQVIRQKLHQAAGREEITSFITKLIAMAAILVAMFGFIFGITPMKNNDMAPKLSSGDLILYYRLDREFRAQDVVIFHKDGRQYVGRVAAKGGDSVEITEDSHLTINGSTVVETDIFYSTPRYGDEVTYPVELKDNQYFILCDYRNGAKDSRYFGPVEAVEIKGKALAVLRRSGL